MSFKKDTIENVDKLDRRSNRQEDLLHRIESRQNIQSDNISKLVVAQNRLIKQLKSSNQSLRKRQHELEAVLLSTIETFETNGARVKFAIDRLAENAGLRIELIEGTEEHIEVVPVGTSKRKR